MKLQIKKLYDNAIVPTRGSAQAAGYDLYARLDTDTYLIPPKETVKVGTGIAVAIPPFNWGGIYARSGLATKQGLRPANCVGVIDSDYRGEVIVALYNDSNEPRLIHNGDRVAQLVITPYVPYDIAVVQELSETDRGADGFGSTGVGVQQDSNSDGAEQLSLFDDGYKPDTA